jgi:hypothetical protein
MIQQENENISLPLIKETSENETIQDSCALKEKGPRKIPDKKEIEADTHFTNENIDDDKALEQTEDFEQKLEFRRWGILIMFFLFSFMYGAGWGTYSAIVDLTKLYYEISAQQVLWFTWQSNFVTLTFSFIVICINRRNKIFINSNAGFTSSRKIIDYLNDYWLFSYHIRRMDSLFVR